MEDNRRIIVNASKDNVRNGSVYDLVYTEIGTPKNFSYGQTLKKLKPLGEYHL
jgi:hypothetical protein